MYMYMYTVHAKSWQYICTTVKLVNIHYLHVNVHINPRVQKCRSPKQVYNYIHVHVHVLMRDEKECTGMQVYIRE